MLDSYIHEIQVHRRSFESCSHHIIVLCHGQAVEVPVRDASGARVSEGQLAKLLVTAEASAKVATHSLLSTSRAQGKDACACVRSSSSRSL